MAFEGGLFGFWWFGRRRMRWEDEGREEREGAGGEGEDRGVRGDDHGGCRGVVVEKMGGYMGDMTVSGFVDGST